jgi:hypothetical protein
MGLGMESVTLPEDLIEYKSRYNEDFELRSSDLAIFTFKLNGPLSIVQNLTLRKYMRIQPADPGAIFVSILILLALTLFIMLITR